MANQAIPHESLLGRSDHRQDPLPNRLGQVGPGLDDDDEADVDLGMAQRTALGARFGVQLAPRNNCAVLCAAWLRMRRFSRRLR